MQTNLTTDGGSSCCLLKEKTVADIFTHRLVTDPTRVTRLEIDGVRLQWKREAGFLGVIFDQRLTWKQHIQHIIDCCKPRLNRMWCISGQSWGADKRWLTHIYLAMIRSIIDYGAQAYSSASQFPLAQLDSDPRTRSPHLLWSHEGNISLFD